MTLYVWTMCVTWSFRNHSNMSMFCWSNIIINVEKSRANFVKTVIYFIQDSLTNRKFNSIYLKQLFFVTI